MRRIRSIQSLVVALSVSGAAAMASGTDVADDSPADPCLAAFQRTFNVPASKLSGLAKSGLPIEEMPVLFFAAGRLQLDSALVLKERLRGRRWQAVLDSFGIGPSVFYASLDAVETRREPFKRLRELKPEEWDRAFLSDRELVDLANMRFVVEAYGALPATFVGMRASGMRPVEVVAWFEVERQDFLDRREDQRRWEEEQLKRQPKNDDDGVRQRELKHLDQDAEDRRREYRDLDQEAEDRRREYQRLDQEAYEKQLEEQRLEEEEYRRRQEEQRRRDEEYRKSHPSQEFIKT